MQTRALVTFAFIIITLVMMGTPSLLAVRNTIITNSSNNHYQFLQQAFAIHMNTATSNEKTVVHQGIIASSPNPQIKPEPNEGRQSAVILPY